MLKPKKTKSGKWTVRVYDYQDAEGKQHYKRITEDTRDACIVAASLFRAEKSTKKDAPDAMTVGEAVDRYIDLCRVLSPTTVSGYEKIRRTAFSDLWGVKVPDLTEEVAQEYLNTEASRMGRSGQISAKTVANEWGLVSTALHKICRVKYEVKLPKRRRSVKEYPEPAQVMEIVRGTSVELPCLLAMWLSFSMSEIRGLQFSDIKGDSIVINRVMVDVDNVPTVKETAKAETRIRRHRLPPYIRALIDAADHSQPWIVPENGHKVYYDFRKLMDAAGLDLTFHQLRHLNASVMLELNVPEKYAMERGGWKTPHVMKTVYQHTFDKKRQAVDDQVDAYFQAILEPKQDAKHDHDSPDC